MKMTDQYDRSCGIGTVSDPAVQGTLKVQGKGTVTDKVTDGANKYRESEIGKRG
jgi:hypothetical protein